MKGGTTFQFVTDGIGPALEQAIAAAQGKDVRIGGGVATVRAYLSAGLVDELHLAISPVLLGRGENLLAGLDLAALAYACTRHVPHVALSEWRLMIKSGEIKLEEADPREAADCGPSPQRHGRLRETSTAPSRPAMTSA